jgi:hypothetical protein
MNLKLKIKNLRFSVSAVVTIAVIIFAGIGFVYRDTIRDLVFALQKPAVPEPMTKEQAKNILQNAGILPPEAPAPKTDQVAEKEAEALALPDEINLDVPFTPQAPFAVWDAFHEDGCEEASALMVGRFWQGKAIDSPADADQELLALGELEIKLFGQNKDTNAEQTAEFMQEFYGFKNVAVRYNITLDDIRAEVGAGRPVILPLYGRELNPYFSNGGPLYHMLVVKGYTAHGQFITNDPGTKRGEDYVYNGTYLMERIHDFNGGDVLNGKKVMIVAIPN